MKRSLFEFSSRRDKTVALAKSGQIELETLMKHEISNAADVVAENENSVLVKSQTPLDVIEKCIINEEDC